MRLYIEQVVRLLEELNLDLVRNLVSLIKKSDTVWVIGNGGSSCAASHLAEDLIKFTDKKAIALTDTPLISMASNDEGIENMFLFPLKRLIKKNDLVIGLTMGGKSKNIVNVMESKELDCSKFLITGLGGKDVKCNKLIVPSINIQACEDCTISIIHLICIFYKGVE